MYNTVSILHMDILTRTRAKTDLFTQPTPLSAHTVIGGREYLQVFHNSLMYLFSHYFFNFTNEHFFQNVRC